MKNKRILILIIVLIIIVGGVIVYKEVEKKQVNNNIKVKATNLENTQKSNQEKEIFDKSIGNINEGQLLEHEGISKDIFKDTKYPGISNEVVTKETTSGIEKQPVEIIIKKYNPNILTQDMLAKYYNEQIKVNKNNNQNITCYLLDVYNNSFAIELFSNTNKFNEFNIGNINEKFELVNNKNSMYCGIKPDGEITSYSNYGNNSAKKEPFILKK
ncbi:hypothetical protein [uncultured Clostridium sp.]|uniref:hypothetical protein n=1 Tax=uncultured Clostridium sp. TaxID=59620 RepID=UPI00262DC8C2|nr:hypothetical protein [uncultured Clostridium sp.]